MVDAYFRQANTCGLNNDWGDVATGSYDIRKRRFYWGAEPLSTVLERAARSLRSKLWRRRFAIALGVLIFILLLLPGVWVQALKAFVIAMFNLPAQDRLGFEHSDKVAHLLLFAVWTPAVLSGWHRDWFIRLVGLLIFAAALSELGQLFVPGRSASGIDFIADCLGIGLGGVVWMFLQKK